MKKNYPITPYYKSHKYPHTISIKKKEKKEKMSDHATMID